MTLDLPTSPEEWMRWVERRIAAQEVRPRSGGTGGALAGFQKGSQPVSFATATTASVNLTFTVGRFTSTPNVHTNIASGSSVAAGWNSRAINVTTSGFTLLLFGPSTAWSSIPVQWTALA